MSFFNPKDLQYSIKEMFLWKQIGTKPSLILDQQALWLGKKRVPWKHNNTRSLLGCNILKHMHDFSYYMLGKVFEDPGMASFYISVI